MIIVWSPSAHHCHPASAVLKSHLDQNVLTAVLDHAARPCRLSISAFRLAFA